jgi:type IX secretion system PorP/SprF family membrane protein
LFKTFLISGLIFLSFLVKGAAQEVIPTYSDYLTDNLYLLHPSMAGASNYNKIRLTGRQQWFDVKNAPNLQTLSVNARVMDKMGIGAIFFNDENGYYSKKGIYGTLAYHLLLSRSELDLNQFSFGISGGIIQHRLDQSNFNGFDPLITSENVSDIYANMDVGMSYYYMDFFAHLTAKNIISVKRSLFYSDAVPSNQRKYLFSTGYVFSKPRSDWSFEPSIMFQIREQTDEKSLDANIKAYMTKDYGGLWGGVSFRRSFEGAEYTSNGLEIKNQKLQYLTTFVGMDRNRFLFAYTYSHQINSVVLSNSGFHQITLGYNFGKNRARYDCHCPAIN